MEKKKFKQYLEKVNLEIEKNQNSLEERLNLNSTPENLSKDLVKLPLNVAEEIYAKINLLAGYIVKYPIAITNYLLQRS